MAAAVFSRDKNEAQLKDRSSEKLRFYFALIVETKNLMPAFNLFSGMSKQPTVLLRSKLK